VIDHHLTFLRWHVAEQLALRAGGAWEGLEAHRALEARLGPSVQDLTLDDFLHGNAPRGLPALYRPAAIHLHPGDARPGEPAALRRAADLSRLLAQQQAHRQTGVLLVGPSGAGKSVALRKTFADCFRPGAPLADADYLPCWLRLRGSRPGPVGLCDLFRHAVTPHVALTDDEQVWTWLDAGPAVLLLCDLDDARHVAPHARLELASFLGQLQGLPRWHGRGHRIIVAYRSGGQLCRVARALLADGHFCRYAHDPFAPDTVRHYARDLRRAERSLGGAPVLDDDAFEARLAEQAGFIDAAERRPLLMHLLADSLAGPATGVQTAAGLLAGLVESQLGHALQSLRPALLDELPEDPLELLLRRWMLTGVTRIARVLWAGRSTLQGLPRQRLDAILRDPGRHLPAGALPPGDYWHKPRLPAYYVNDPDVDRHLSGFVGLVCEAPWLCGDNEQGWLLAPPVLINFFAALPVRYRDVPPDSLPGPHEPLEGVDPWCEEVVALFSDDSQRPAWVDERDPPGRLWQQAAALLGGLLGEGEFLALVRAWLRRPEPALLRVGHALLHGRDPAPLPAPPGCQDDLLPALRDALREALDQGNQAPARTVCQEYVGANRPDLLLQLDPWAG
jgi:hypothetical protein